MAHLPQIMMTQRHRGAAGRSWPSGPFLGALAVPSLLLRAHKQGSPRVFLCGWRLGIQLAGMFPFLSHAPRWEMIHENQEGKISPKAAE